MILMQFVSFSFFTVFTASMQCSTPLISASDSFAARSFSISPKSRVPQSSPTMSETMLSCDKDSASGCVVAAATARSALDGDFSSLLCGLAAQMGD